jgi:hypothetical protein
MTSDRLSISAKVIADSIYEGSRLTTIEATFRRIILSEFNTHRVLSRNSASSRAIPVWKKLRDISSSPYVPLQFGRNKSGMQSTEEISRDDITAARENWLVGRDVALLQAFILAGGEEQIMKDSKGNPEALEVCGRMHALENSYPDVFGRLRSMSVGVHKQHANRVLEPYSWHTVITTGSHWRNFYALRASKKAQPEIQTLAIAMAEAQFRSDPNILWPGEWHLPYINEEDRKEVRDPKLLARISSARCARVSYLTHDGKRSLEKDFDMANGLQCDGHTSPFEHPAMARDPRVEPYTSLAFGGNFDHRWVQYRKMLPNENDFSKLIDSEELLEGMKGDQALLDFVLSLPE